LRESGAAQPVNRVRIKGLLLDLPGAAAAHPGDKIMANFRAPGLAYGGAE